MVKREQVQLLFFPVLSIVLSDMHHDARILLKCMLLLYCEFSAVLPLEFVTLLLGGHVISGVYLTKHNTDTQRACTVTHT